MRPSPSSEQVAVRQAQLAGERRAHLVGDQPAGPLDGAARHPRLAGRRRRPGRADARRVGRLEHDVLDAEHRLDDLRGDGDEPLADLGDRARHPGGAVGHPHPGLESSSKPSENIRFLNPTATPTPRRTRRGSAVRPAPPGSARAARRRAGDGQRVGDRGPDALGDRRRAAVTFWPVGSTSPVRMALRSRSSTGSMPSALRPACPSATRGRSTPARRRSPAWPRTAGCWCARRRRRSRRWAPGRARREAGGVGHHRGRRGGVGAAVEDEPGLDLHQPPVVAWRGGGSASVAGWRCTWPRNDSSRR